MSFKIVHDEHEQMRKPCEKCGGKMYWVAQALRADEEPGDYLAYRCNECGNTVTKFFPFPEEYAKFFRVSTKPRSKNFAEIDKTES